MTVSTRNRMGSKIESASTGGIIHKGWLKFAAVPIKKWSTYEPEKFEINPAFA